MRRVQNRRRDAPPTIARNSSVAKPSMALAEEGRKDALPTITRIRSLAGSALDVGVVAGAEVVGSQEDFRLAAEEARPEDQVVADQGLDEGGTTRGLEVEEKLDGLLVALKPEAGTEEPSVLKVEAEPLDEVVVEVAVEQYQAMAPCKANKAAPSASPRQISSLRRNSWVRRR